MIIKLPDGAVHAKKRVGRGAASRTGCTAGRGTKGQKSRSGKKLRPGFEGGQMPLYRRVPRRGFSNYKFKQIPMIISLSDIDKKYEAGDVVSLKTLHDKNIVRSSVQCVKLLCNGDITKPVTLSVDIFTSKDAVEKIKKAGGGIMQNDASVPANKEIRE